MILSALIPFGFSLWWLFLPALGFVSIADVMRPLSVDDIRQSIYNVLGVVGVNTTTWKPGAVVRTMITAVSIVLSYLSRTIALLARGGFLETAEGFWLTLCARYVFGVRRELATFASGEVTLVNGGGGVFSFDADEVIFSNPDTGKTYRNTSAFTLGALGTVTIPVAAVESGAASTAVPGAITVLETTLIGVTVTNALALVGLDEEGDEQLKTRCLEKLGSLSPNGPWDAYSYTARNAKRADGTRIGITRVSTSRDGYGNLFVRVATASGAVTGDAADATTDLGAINDAIQRRATPLCVTSHVLSADNVAINVTYTAYLRSTSGRSEVEILAAITTKLASWMATLDIGGDVIAFTGSVFTDAIAAVIRSALPEIFHVVVHSPAAHVALSSAQVPVLGTTSGTVVQVAPNGGI